jgi:hypothetical protein
MICDDVHVCVLRYVSFLCTYGFWGGGIRRLCERCCKNLSLPGNDDERRRDANIHVVKTVLSASDPIDEQVKVSGIQTFDIGQWHFLRFYLSNNTS